MNNFAKILIAAAAAAVTVVAAKKIIEEVEKNDKDNPVVKAYKKFADAITKPFKTERPRDEWTVDFYEEDEEIEAVMEEEDESHDFLDAVEDIAFYDDDAQADEDIEIDFIQPEDGSMSDDELQELFNEEAAQEQIERLLSEIDEEKGEDE